MNIYSALMRALPKVAPVCFLVASVSSCASMVLHEGGTLASYSGLVPSGGTLTKSKLRVDSSAVLSAKTVRIVPVSSQVKESDRSFDQKDLALVTNAVDRALCVGLADRFRIVGVNEPADLTVHATITNIIPTNKTAAATSAVTTLGVSALLALPAPRIPIGLGGLSIEAEAIAADGSQEAAMLWSRGADMLTTRARVSEIGDAYALSSSFASDFSRMLVSGKDPFKGHGVALPSMQKIKSSLGARPTYEACNAFGVSPGIRGAVAGQLGLPPGWTDKGGEVSR